MNLMTGPESKTAAPAGGRTPVRALPPGSTIGILGGGQLGRMLALAAAQLGLRTHIYCEDSGPAFDVAPATTLAGYDDRAALADFAENVDVVTYEFENVPVETVTSLDAMVPVRPGLQALRIAQDRLAEKEFISALGIEVAPFAKVDSLDDLTAAVKRFSAAPAILKTRRLGYDGKGQLDIDETSSLRKAVEALEHAPAIIEKRVSFDAEISVLVVRAGDGAMRFYDCPLNRHDNGILRSSRVPAALPGEVIAQAQTIAGKVARALDYVGVLAVELFYCSGGDEADRGNPALMVNEIAPRVHNSGHWTLDACAVSQFENHIRAIAGWPLGATTRHSDAVMENLIGSQVEDWASEAAGPGTCLHIYGKHKAREGRKMGHLTRLLPRKDA